MVGRRGSGEGGWKRRGGGWGRRAEVDGGERGCTSKLQGLFLFSFTVNCFVMTLDDED